MFDIGWTELLLIGVLILFMFGPEDIPKIMYNLGKVLRRFRYMRYALSSQFEDFMEKAESAGKVPAEKTEQLMRDSHPNDETDADEYLMEMLPPPEQELPEKSVSETDEQPTDPAKPV